MREDFTASEAQTLTGINVETQRVWRRRHLKIGTGEGWTRYSYSDVVVLACLAELTKAGIAIGHATDIVSRDEVWRSIMVERDYDRIGEPLEDRLIVVAPVTVDGIGLTHDFVFCVLRDLPKVFLNAEGGYVPAAACLTVLNTSYVRRQVNERMEKLT